MVGSATILTLQLFAFPAFGQIRIFQINQSAQAYQVFRSNHVLREYHTSAVQNLTNELTGGVSQSLATLDAVLTVTNLSEQATASVRLHVTEGTRAGWSARARVVEQVMFGVETNTDFELEMSVGAVTHLHTNPDSLGFSQGQLFVILYQRGPDGRTVPFFQTTGANETVKARGTLLTNVVYMFNTAVDLFPIFGANSGTGDLEADGSWSFSLRIGPSAEPPELTATVSGVDEFAPLNFRWSGEGFVLQASSALDSGSDWQTLSLPVATDGQGNHTVSIPLIYLLDNQYFRLADKFSIPACPDGASACPPPVMSVPEATFIQEFACDDCDSDAAESYGYKVLLPSGEERLERVDLSIPGLGGMDFLMKRTYRSQLNYPGPLGFGWTFTLNDRLFPQPNGDVRRLNARSHLDVWTRQADGSFASPPGHFSDLIWHPSGVYIMRTPGGLERVFLSDGRLACLRDASGNRLLLTYDSRGNLQQVVDPYGRRVDFAFQQHPDGVDRLSRIRDFAGREVIYRYDTAGDLVEVRTPVVMGTSTGNDFPAGRVERYTYSSGYARPELNHNLLSVTMPEEVARSGPPVLQWVYGTDPEDSLHFDRVVREIVGGTNASAIPAGGTTQFDYQVLNADAPPGNPELPRTSVLVTEANGNQRSYLANELNHTIIRRRLTRGLRSGEPAFYETRSFYNADGQLTREVLPEGNETRYIYDQTGDRRRQGNVLEIRHVAGPRGGGEDRVTTYTYEPLYNRIASVTDPRGNSSAYRPPLGAASAERYTRHFYYDYQESNLPVPAAARFGINLAGVKRGLGDLNGDGRTNQMFGNPVRIQAPSVQLRPDSHEAQNRGSAIQEIVTEVQWNDHGQVTASIDPEGNVTDFRYYTDRDPDGDGRPTPSHGFTFTGQPVGYLKSIVADARISARRRSTTPPAALETVFRYDDVGNVVAERNPRGVETHIEVNALNQPVAVTRGADISAARSSGQLLTGEEALRYQTRFFYDANGWLTETQIENRDSTTPDVGRYLHQFARYDILGHLVEARREIGGNEFQIHHFRYDPLGLPVLTVQPEGNQSLTRYDERNLPFEIIRGVGTPVASTNRFDYDLNGNLLSVTDSEDNDGDGLPEAISMIYDGFDREVEVRDPLGNRSRVFHDIASQIIRRQFFGHPAGKPGSSPILLTESFDHHDELGRVYRSDQRLFVSEGISPVRPVELQDGNNDGLVTSMLEYDALNRPTYAIQDDLQVTQWIYDGLGRWIETVDSGGNRSVVEYDKNSNPVAIRSVEVSLDNLVAPESYLAIVVRDQLDRVVRLTDNAGQTTYFSYDSRDQLTLTADPEGPEITDPLGLFPRSGQSGRINAPGNTISWVYDGLGRRIREIHDLRVNGKGGNPLDLSNPFNPDGQVTLTYEFDRNSRLIGIVDDNGHRTSFGYDELDRRVLQTLADGARYLVAYDRDGNVVRRTDPNGSVETRAHDALNRVVRVDVSRGPGVRGTTQVTHEYDGLSRWTRSTDDNGSPAATQVVERDYDSLSRLLEERQNGRAVSFTYSGDGKRLTLSYPGGRKIRYTHDVLDRVKTISDQDGLIAESFWMGSGYRELKRANGNGTVLSFLNDLGDRAVGYDATKRIIQLRCLPHGSGKPILDRNYHYNRTGMRLNESRRDDDGLEDQYTYDSMYRLTEARLDTGGAPTAFRREPAHTAYLLDGVGNRRIVRQTSTMGETIEQSYEVNELNQYTTVNRTTQIHDPNGNLIDDSSAAYAYDYQNRLIRVYDPSSSRVIADYAYLPDMRRNRKSVPGGAHGVPETIAYLYDGWRCLEESSSAPGASRISYSYSPKSVDEMLEFTLVPSTITETTRTYVHQNSRADVVVESGASGAPTERRRFDPFGSSEDAVGSNNPHRFQGGRRDDETGLYHMRHRQYSPETGRFLQRDPRWDPANVGNAYSFPGMNPVNLLDPYGLDGDTPGWDLGEEMLKNAPEEYSKFNPLERESFWDDARESDTIKDDNILPLFWADSQGVPHLSYLVRNNQLIDYNIITDREHSQMMGEKYRRLFVMFKASVPGTAGKPGRTVILWKRLNPSLSDNKRPAPIPIDYLPPQTRREELDKEGSNAYLMLHGGRAWDPCPGKIRPWREELVPYDYQSLTSGIFVTQAEIDASKTKERQEEAWREFFLFRNLNHAPTFDGGWNKKSTTTISGSTLDLGSESFPGVRRPLRYDTHQPIEIHRLHQPEIQFQAIPVDTPPLPPDPPMPVM